MVPAGTMLSRSLVALAVAAAAPIYPVTPVYDGMPPPRLRDPLSKPLRVVYGHLEACGTPKVPNHPQARFAACTRRGGVIYLPNPCDYGDREEFARLACHEQAHREGWGADHGP